MTKKELVTWFQTAGKDTDCEVKEAYSEAIRYIKGWDKLISAVRKERDSYGPFDSNYASDTLEGVLTLIKDILDEKEDI